MNKERWQEMNLEEKVEALRELVEFLAQGYFELVLAFSDAVNTALQEFKESYSILEKELFGGGKDEA